MNHYINEKQFYDDSQEKVINNLTIKNNKIKIDIQSIESTELYNNTNEPHINKESKNIFCKLFRQIQ
jgi:hypothetical protein